MFLRVTAGQRSFSTECRRPTEKAGLRTSMPYHTIPDHTRPDPAQPRQTASSFRTTTTCYSLEQRHRGRMSVNDELKIAASNFSAAVLLR
jgi:hypothetical protein